MQNSFQYSGDLYCAGNTSFFKGILPIAKAMLKAIPGDVDTLVSAGSSGCSIAAAILVLCQQQGKRMSHIHVFPPNTTSHRGLEKVSSGYASKGKSCFVDDLLDTGKTLRCVSTMYSDIDYALFYTSSSCTNLCVHKLTNDLNVRIIFCDDGPAF